MRTITHREMRNNSAEVLRSVAAGESIQVTNNGVVAAVIGPPPADPYRKLVERGEIRPGSQPRADLLGLHRRRSSTPTAAMLADLRGDR